ncbi:MAG TPA: hypothetical protein VNW71_08850 [Thermoanaerobaculia bacterium]|nr:hypothetical protein [Thermoanaerobaculia bacterium]
MRPMLDDLELPQVQEIRTHDLRALAEHKPPGMSGSLLQNLGRRPTVLLLWGVASGPEARDFITSLEDKFRAAQPVPFTADIASDTGIETVRIADLKLDDLAGRPDRFTYILTLRQHIEPVEPEDTSFVDDELLGDATGLIDGLVDGLDLGLELVTGLEQFVSPLTDLLTRLQDLNRGNASP